MNPEFTYPSLVNLVVRIQCGNRTNVRKYYTDKAIGTGVPVPLERMLIEQRVLEALGRTSHTGFAVPRIIGKGEAYLDLDLLDGIPAIDALACWQNATWLTRWNMLGTGLGQVEKYLRAHSDEVFSDLHAIQEQCANAMDTRKCPGVLIEPNERRWVSLGDVGVKNILAGTSGFYMLDFEFAHFSRRSRDVGQLVAQLLSLEKREVAAAVEDGYLTSTSEASADLTFWKNAFTNYYGANSGVN